MGTFRPYSDNKESNIEWVGSVPKHWEVKPLFGVATTESVKNEDGKETNVLSLSYGNIIRRDVEKNFGLLPESFNTYQLVNPGELILRLTDLQNDKRSLRVGHAKERGIITSAYLKLVAKKCELDDRYLYRLLHSYDTTKVFYGMGGGLRQSMKFEEMRRLPIVLPSLEEQQKIANFLDHETAKIDTLIEKQQQLIALLKEKRQAVISHAVTKGLNPNAPMRDSGVEWLGEVPEHWDVAKVKYFASIQGGYAFSSDSFQETGVQLLRIGNVYLNRLALERQPTFVDESFVESHKDFSVRRGDILMSLTGTLGKTDYGFAVHVNEDGPFVLNQRVAKITPVESKIAPEYLIYSIRSEPYLKQLYSLPSGTKQANLSNDDVINIPIVVPPTIEEQLLVARHIYDDLGKYNLLIKKSEDAIDLIQERRTALISAAVTGKIDVRNWSLEHS